MPLIPTAGDIALRLALTVLAGLLIGLNRSERGRAAGLRTTLLVCLAASLSMILPNLLMNSRGKTPDSFVVLDLMRFPLGVLSGIGFIGAGAIVRRNDLVMGVTTAATLWFVTMLGMCFGAGQNALGLVSLGIGLFVLWILQWVEGALKREQRATLTVWFHAGVRGEPESDLRAALAATPFRIDTTAVGYEEAGRRRCVKLVLRWQSRDSADQPPALVQQWARRPDVTRLHWEPTGLEVSDDGGEAGV